MSDESVWSNWNVTSMTCIPVPPAITMITSGSGSILIDGGNPNDPLGSSTWKPSSKANVALPSFKFITTTDWRFSTKDGKFVASIDVPGLTIEQLSVVVVNDELIVSGQRLDTKESVYHRFAMKDVIDKVDLESIDAVLENGVLDVLFGTKQVKVHKQIKVRKP